MSSFDFVEYIVSRIPSLSSTQITIQPFSGGLVNSTVRASFHPPVVFRSQQLPSVVLKHATPFMAFDPTQRLSTSRQAVEAWALNVLSGVDSSIPELSILIAAFPQVQIPRLIYHDESNHVLWISDLGETQTLSQYLCSSPPPCHEEVARIATQVTGFATGMLRATTTFAAKASESLSCSSDSVRFLGESVASTAGRVLVQFGIPDAQDLTSRMLHAAREKTQEPYLGMIDLWPGNILITATGKCAFVDWELFDVGTAGTSLGFFMAAFHVFLSNDETPSSSKEVIQIFITHLLRTWKNSYGPVSSYFKHHFLIAYGGELLGYVEFPSCPIKLSDASKASLVLAGAQCLRAAGSSSHDVDPSRLDGLGDIWERLWEDVQELFQDNPLRP